MAINEIKILSAGAPKTGVANCAEAFRKKTGIAVSYAFATAPTLKETISSETAEADIVVAPLATIKMFETGGQVITDSGAIVGSVKAAVTIKNGAVKPNLTSGETLKQAILKADSIVYNEASSGQYIAAMIEKMGITKKISSKVIITKTGSAVMQHLDQSSLTNEIGFGQATEIQVQIDKGCDVILLGTLPKDVEKVTTYQSALLTGAANNPAAKDLLDFMASAEGQRICKATGLI